LRIEQVRSGNRGGHAWWMACVSQALTKRRICPYQPCAGMFPVLVICPAGLRRG
jgi:hypothetical protein